jgi:hypothetical protein
MEKTINEIVGLVNFDLNHFLDRELLYSQLGIIPEVRLADLLEVAFKAETFINDHNKGEEKFDGFVVLRNGHVCLIHKNNLFCLNKLYIGKEGKIHLSASSVAGNMITINKTLEEAVNEYNTKTEEGLRSIYGRDNADNMGTLVVYFYENK